MERSFRQRMLDAAATAAGMVLPVFLPTADRDQLGTFDGEYGQQPLTTEDMLAPIQTAMPMHIPVPQQYMVGTTRGVVFDVTPSHNPQINANGHSANIGIPAPVHLAEVAVAAVATTGVTPATAALATTGVTPAPAAQNATPNAEHRSEDAAISASVQDVGQSVAGSRDVGRQARTGRASSVISVILNSSGTHSGYANDPSGTHSAQPDDPSGTHSAGRRRY